MEKNNITISKMTIADLDKIKNELFDNFDNLWNYQIFKEELANTNSEYLVLKNDNEVLGYAGIKIVLDIADIMDIVIRKDLRGNRIIETSFKKNNRISKTKTMHSS